MKSFFIIFCLCGSTVVGVGMSGCGANKNGPTDQPTPRVIIMPPQPTPSPEQIAAYEKSMKKFRSPYYEAAREWKLLQVARTNANFRVRSWVLQANEGWKEVKLRNLSKGNTEDRLEEKTRDERETIQSPLREMQAGVRALPAKSRHFPAAKQRQLTAQVGLIDRALAHFQKALESYDVRGVEASWATVAHALEAIEKLYPKGQLDPNFLKDNYSPDFLYPK